MIAGLILGAVILAVGIIIGYSVPFWKMPEVKGGRSTQDYVDLFPYENQEEIFNETAKMAEIIKKKPKDILDELNENVI